MAVRFGIVLLAFATSVFYHTVTSTDHVGDTQEENVLIRILQELQGLKQEVKALKRGAIQTTEDIEQVKVSLDRATAFTSIVEQRVSDLEDVDVEGRVRDLEDVHLERVLPTDGSGRRLVKISIPSTSMRPEEDNTRNSLSENCTLGRDYVYEEYIDTYGQGMTIPDWEYTGSSPYQCLYQCLKDARCTAVSVELSPVVCIGYYDVLGTMPAAGWNFYNLTQLDSCIVTGSPAIMFQASISADVCIGLGEVVNYDLIRTNTTPGLDNGVFTVPVRGIYEITVNAQSEYKDDAQNHRKIYLVIVQNGVRMADVYSMHDSGGDNSTSNAHIPVSVLSLLQADAGDTIWVEGGSSDYLSCLSHCTWTNTFTAVLINMLF